MLTKIIIKIMISLKNKYLSSKSIHCLCLQGMIVQTDSKIFFIIMFKINNFYKFLICFLLHLLCVPKQKCINKL